MKDCAAWRIDTQSHPWPEGVQFEFSPFPLIQNVTVNPHGNDRGRGLSAPGRLKREERRHARKKKDKASEVPAETWRSSPGTGDETRGEAERFGRHIEGTWLHHGGTWLHQVRDGLRGQVIPLLKRVGVVRRDWGARGWAESDRKPRGT
ncbi:hypothetical protein NDU88_000383 [Pleurodeles waltl]|uniref:Uncharacterized protein n=1 Tax=Pleurodeles waltl TaxID=8319 RepID=A0AAV7URP6_PLEWA|nr:hypothetical protein NDU88_000383 [Pleurodeles waltl]